MALLAAQTLGVGPSRCLAAGPSTCQPVQVLRPRPCSCAARSRLPLPAVCSAATVESHAPSTSQAMHVLAPCAAGRLIYNGTAWVEEHRIRGYEVGPDQKTTISTIANLLQARTAVLEPWLTAQLLCARLG